MDLSAIFRASCVHRLFGGLAEGVCVLLFLRFHENSNSDPRVACNKFNRTIYSKNLRDTALTSSVQLPGEVSIVRAHVKMPMPAEIEKDDLPFSLLLCA